MAIGNRHIAVDGRQKSLSTVDYSTQEPSLSCWVIMSRYKIGSVSFDDESVDAFEIAIICNDRFIVDEPSCCDDCITRS